MEFVSRLLARSLEDPRVRSVTLTGAEVRPDLKHARIYFTVRDGAPRKDEALAGLYISGLSIPVVSFSCKYFLGANTVPWR